MIPVSKPFLDPEREYVKIISKISSTENSSDADQLVQTLEKKLEEHLNISNLSFVSNRAHALELAIKSLKLKGEIIAAPFDSFSTDDFEDNVFGDCNLVFADIEESTLNIDTTKIENLITNRTSAILATHVYGNPCDVLEIDRIAKKYNLKVIYDGTDAFNVQLYNKSIFNYGDVSICSTRSTKLFNSVEGAFVVCKNKSDFLKLKETRNTAVTNKSFSNTLNSGFYASMGILNIKYIQKILEKRKKLINIYDEYLSNIDVVKPTWHKNSSQSYACYTIIFPNELLMLRCLNSLKLYNISAAKCFYPSIYCMLSNTLKVANNLSKRVLNLPLYYDLKVDEVALICAIIQYEFLLFDEN